MARGVMQNLTVVPHPDAGGEYLIVIGHRRHAAARIAGLAALPCAVADMGEKEQVATMLLENMQRSDLTLDEQAQGFQMMIDLGETVSSVAEKTGLSQKTVKQRLGLAALDPAALRESQMRGGRMEDYARLGKIEDLAKRNELLEKIGTANFNWEYERAVREQEINKYRPGLIEAAKTFASPMKSYGYRYSGKYSLAQRAGYDKDGAVEVPEDAGEAVYRYYDGGSYVEIYKEDGEAETAAPGKTEAEMEMERRKKSLKDAFKQAFGMRWSFVKGFKPSKADGAYRAIDEMAAEALFAGNHIDEDRFREFYGIEGNFRHRYEDGEGETYEEAVVRVMDGLQAVPVLLAAAYLSFEGYKIRDCISYRGMYEPDEELLRLYHHLKKLGYEMSGEEEKLLGGTHEDYARPEPEDEG